MFLNYIYSDGSFFSNKDIQLGKKKKKKKKKKNFQWQDESGILEMEAQLSGHEIMKRKAKDREQQIYLTQWAVFFCWSILCWICLLSFRFSDILSVWPSKSSPETDEWKQSSRESYQD